MKKAYSKNGIPLRNNGIVGESYRWQSVDIQCMYYIIIVLLILIQKFKKCKFLAYAN